MSDYNEIMDAVIKGQEPLATELAAQLIKAGQNPNDVITNALNVAMDTVGKRMKSGEMFIPEVLMSAKAMSAAIDVFKPHMKAGELKTAGTVVLGSVKGDLHDIGKDLVKLMMEGAGFTVIDMGVDVEPEAFLKAARENNAQIIGLSALLTTTMPQMRRTVEVFKEAGIRDKVKFILGGAPIDQRFTDEIGADGYGENAGSAVEIAKELLA